jgi:tetratricopeptide (TPR) repeat protein
MAAAYRSLLAGRRTLIVLDNARDARQVRPLLPGIGDCVALVTSRDSLAGLVAREGAVRMELGALSGDEAQALLRELLDSRAERDPDAVAGLAALCCHLPLALRVAAELAAARPSLSLAELVGELADRQRRLDAFDADGDDATAVRAVFSWSYRNLDGETARAFRLTAMHPGADVDHYAAAALLGSTVDQVDRLLDRLVRAHLVHTTGPDRYGMHDLLRAYARERVAAEENEQERQAALTAVLDYYLHTAAAAMNTLYPAEARRRPQIPASSGIAAPVAEPAAARAWLDAERANLIVIAALAADHGWAGHTTALASTVERYLSFSYHLPEAVAIHNHALRAARQRGDRSAEATALTNLGMIEWMQNRYENAVKYQHLALSLFRGTADRHGEARALHRLAIVERRLGNLDAAADYAGQVLEVTRQNGDRLGQARALHMLGTTHQREGHNREPADYLRQSLALSEALGDRLGESVTVRELGMIELRHGRLDSAAEYLQRALDLCRVTDNQNGQAGATSRLGLIHQLNGRYEQAAEYQRHALTLFRQIKDRHGEGESLTRLALAESRAGRHHQALTHLDEALDLSREIGVRSLECNVLNSLGEALLVAGRPDQAHARHTAALDLARRTDDQDEQTRAQRGLARTQPRAQTGHQPQD